MHAIQAMYTSTLKFIFAVLYLRKYLHFEHPEHPVGIWTPCRPLYTLTTLNIFDVCNICRCILYPRKPKKSNSPNPPRTCLKMFALPLVARSPPHGPKTESAQNHIKHFRKFEKGLLNITKVKKLCDVKQAFFGLLKNISF